MVANKYSRIVIIYNPKSTGDAKSKAHRLARRLRRRKVTTVDLQATEYAGHAEELAYKTAVRYRHPLVISVSGDGGYHEVVNGVLRAMDEGRAGQPVCAIYPAGNANDHRRGTKKRPLTWAVLRSRPEPIDVLRLDAEVAGRKLTRYAHSYIGFGVTSEAAAELNRVRLTPFSESRIVTRTILSFTPFTIQLPDGETRKLDSLVFANIHQMSKFIRLGRKGEKQSGHFRVIAIPHRNRLRFILTLMSIALFGFRHPPQTDDYEFDLVDTQLVHLDGEVSKIAGGSHVRVECVTDKLLTVR